MAVLMWAPAASAGTIICNDATGARSGPISGDIVVPSSGSARLAARDSTGNITAQSGAGRHEHRVHGQRQLHV